MSDGEGDTTSLEPLSSVHGDWTSSRAVQAAATSIPRSPAHALPVLTLQRWSPQLSL